MNSSSRGYQRVTIYVPRKDAEIVRTAASLTGDRSLSSLVVRLIRQELKPLIAPVETRFV